MAPSNRRFTLVELMIVVAIIAVLAAIAVPVLAEHANDAKVAEETVNVDGILAANEAFLVEHPQDHWAEFDPVDKYDVDKTLRDWVPVNAAEWSMLGWAPDGGVRCTYRSLIAGGMYAHSGESICNVDGDADYRAHQVQVTKGTRNAEVQVCMAVGGGTTTATRCW